LTQPTADRHPASRRCQLCGSTTLLRPAAIVRPSVVEAIRAEHPEWSDAGFICHSDLARYRALHVERILEGERGELTQLEHQVIDSLAKHEILAENVDAEFEGELSLGERLADRIADFGGSWTFILCFGVALAAWVLINTAFVVFGRFDPYPFILLNLILSCIAALQAPVIMMSQNRLEAKDRRRSEHDYRVNLKAELEIRHLHEKLDHLLSHQWERLIEVQQVQLELLEELAEARSRVARRRAEAGPTAPPPEPGERD
jgi:uncharacterized membrane protein